MEGNLIDESVRFTEEEKKGDEACVADMGIQALRFFNCEMYYTDKELDLLMQALNKCKVEDRLTFFSESLRLRKRERNLWIDTPLAKVFTDKEDWHLLKARAKIQQVETAIKIKKKLDARKVFLRFDADGDQCLSYEELQRALEAMGLGFSPRDVAEIVRLADRRNVGKVSVDDFAEVFSVPVIDEEKEKLERQKSQEKVVEPVATTWSCSNCTYLNSVFDNTCVMCCMGWTGKREVPPGYWICAGETGGCTFFNPNTQFYCEVCNRSRADLASVRF